MRFFIPLSLLFISQACSLNSNQLSPDTLENTARLLWMTDTDFSQFPSDIQTKLLSSANSETNFGNLFTQRVTGLLANPDSYTPDYSSRYGVLLEQADKLTAHQAYARTALLGLDSSAGYPLLPDSYSFSFPRDDSPQFQYQTGWHFFVGSVFDANGHEYGVELMFWQYALIPGLSNIGNQILELHFAITPAGDRHYRSKPYVTAGTSGLISFSANPFNYQFGKNSIQSTQASSLFPLRLRAWGIDNSQGDSAQIEMDVTLTQTKGYVLNGDEGLSPSCGGIGTLYYSVPNLQIDATQSWLRVKGNKVALNKGIFWYDHQWGTGLLPAGNPRIEILRAATMADTAHANPSGWEWSPMQFEDGTEIVLYAPHTHKLIPFYQNISTTPPGTMVESAQGLYIDVSGTYKPITGTLTITEWVQASKSDDQYMPTYSWYPNRVEVDTSASSIVPTAKQHLTLVPIVSTGQQGWSAAGAAYSEGAVHVLTSEGSRVGYGFLESTGYGNPTEQILNLAGLSGIQLPISVPSEEQITAATQFVSQNLGLLTEVLGYCKGIP